VREGLCFYSMSAVIIEPLLWVYVLYYVFLMRMVLDRF
jgi:hypothetical protein